jgi:hydroxymethylpyrimidine pyrophosphatase-like HAD family hydrolase
MEKHIIAFDLDGTLIDSTHRQNGTLSYWIENNSRENIFKDTLLPLTKAYFHFAQQKTEKNYLLICVTARTLSKHDFDYFEEHQLHFDHVLYRKTEQDQLLKDHELKHKKLKNLFKRLNKKQTHIPLYAFDDIQENLMVFEKLGFNSIDAKVANKTGLTLH